MTDYIMADSIRCKYCGSFVCKKPVPPHIGLYCSNPECGKWQKWVKQNIPKNKTQSKTNKTN